ncbi:hypothetical protein RDI86_08810 [Cellulosimicrobium sp. XJ-DQ-B-000]|uniref:hypothetical protein n=1 Tax=Cellulosimicrobium sp. XJ-DQ-B-000 TaxID=3072182 RepID=UPI002809E971|nr:hypothetical protein [Cellulosimicrobium sp. XJ-DQ-B-000]MDQ8041954.1 hypothetical protein [Cellulosimicrobium sp. XJ-DQ-B-000]
MDTVAHETLQQGEIDETYRQLGLGTMESRAQFLRFDLAPRPTMHFDVVITTTSQPFSH